LNAEQILERYPFYNVDDIVLGSINTVDEGYWEGSTVFEWWRKSARERGVEYIQNEVVSMSKNASGTRVESVTLKSGEVIHCDKVLNASGPRAVLTSRMAGIELPVEPRKRFTWMFKAEQPLDRDLPLTIDPSGVHMREVGGGIYQAGGHSEIDPAVDYDDFAMDLNIWQDKIWPTIATRVPQFEAVKVTSEWAGHYAYNTFDHNAIMGQHNEIDNFYFLNGFSGHGLQQSPAMGRGTAEMLVYGEYRSLDMSPFNYDRIVNNTPIVEKAVI
jgi:glycine/D-amino acid oxidase-like deaminating enzyme